MHARDYNRLIEVWLNVTSTDEYGGQITAPTLVKKVWAKVTTNAGNKFVNFGIQDFKNPAIFSVRAIKNGINYTENNFIKYQGQEFYIKGFDNKKLEGMELDIFADGK